MGQLRKADPTQARGTLRLLIAEDSPADVELIVAVLKRAGYAVSFDVADTLELFVERLRSGDYSLILSDHNLQSWTGMDALEKLRESGKDIPLVVVTAMLGDEGAVEYIKQGAADFVLKHRVERLPVVVSQALRDRAHREARARLQEEVLSSKRDWELTFDAVPDGILLLDDQCRVQRANRAATEVLGKPFSDLVGRPCYEALHASEAERPDCPHAVLLATGREAWGEVEEPRLGKIFHATSTPLRDSAGKLYGCVYVMRDITERKRAEKALLKSDERFRLATRATNDAVWDWDLETNQMWWNETVSERFGYKTQEVGADFDWRTERIHEEDRPHVLSSLQGVIASGVHAWSAEYRFQRADGKYAEVLDRGYVIRNPQGKGVRMIGAITDLTERKQLEGQLQQAVKMEAIGRLAGGVAHDFNNMLGIMMGYSELLAVALPEAEAKLQGYCAEIKKAGHKAAGLTRQLLAFSRQQVLTPRVVSVNRILEETESMLKRMMGEDVALEIKPAEDLWLTKTDADQMNQILMNLAANARDAMPNGGEFSIRTSNVTLDESYLQMHPVVAPGEYVLISVSDTGLGMDDKTRLHIFEPFFTTKAPGKGTGLGLATVYGIVKQSGGFIWVYSEVGHGTTFKIYLPRTTETGWSEAASAPLVQPVRGNETLLLVEDEGELRRITRQLLEQGGYRVIEAENAFRALQIVQEYAGTIHMVVTDVVMPGMSGPELTQRMKELCPEARVLYISGYADRAFQHHGVEEGVPILEKPYSGSDLLSKVQEVLRRG